MRFQHQQQFVIVKHNARAHFQKRVDNKNTIQDGGSTALFAAYTVDTVYTVYTIETALHCKTLASIPIHSDRKGLNAIGRGGCTSEKKWDV